MRTSTLKKEINQAVNLAHDTAILEAVYTILKRTNNSEVDELSPLTVAQKKDLDKRLSDHNNGKLKYYTIDEVRKAVSKAIKK